MVGRFLNYLILDLETSVSNIGDSAVGTFKASPFAPSNRIVSYGWLSRDDPNVHIDYMVDTPSYNLTGIDVIVCHNMQFDFAYLMVQHPAEMLNFLKRGGKIHCTMVAEYLLTNLLHKMPSLNDTSVKYGGCVKEDLMKKYWDAGIKTEDIPRHIHDPYLVDDVENTHKIYLGQMEKAKELGMLPLFDCHFEAMIGLIQMNINGLKFDVKFARKEAFRLTQELLELREQVVEFMSSNFVTGFEVNPNSDQQLSSLLFGGPYKYRKRGPILNKDGTLACKQEKRPVPKLDADGAETYYKSGKRKGEMVMRQETYDGEPKTKWYDCVGRCKGLGFVPNKKWVLKDTRYFSVGGDNLKVLMRQDRSKRIKDFLANIVELSTIEKDLTTYFIGYNKLVWPDSGVIHANFNTALTKTGRLSSSAPNMQNLSKKGGSKIKYCFVSRWGEDGRIVEADLSQIEVVVQAFLSQDKQMCADVWAGVDFHCKKLAYKLDEDYQYVYDKCHVEEDPIYKDGRTSIKEVTFKRIFGAGAQSIADVTGRTVKEIKELIASEEKLYPGIVDMQNDWIEEVEENRHISGRRTPKGEPAKESFLHSLTGKRYGYVEEDTPKNMQLFAAYRDALRSNHDLIYAQFKNYGKPKSVGFKSTKIKNYKIQGLAGEIIYLIIGELSRRLLGNSNCLLINTVHDSVILDVHVSILDEVNKMLIEVMELAPTLFERTFGIKFNLPTHGEVENGVTWGSKKKVALDTTII